MSEHLLKLKRACPNCPFRIGAGKTIPLRPVRVAEIAAADVFYCHKTVDYSGDEDDEVDPDDDGSAHANTSESSMCYGHLALHKHNPTQMMRVMARLGALDLDKLDTTGIHTSVTSLVADHAGDDYEEPEPCAVSGYNCQAPAGWQTSNGVQENLEAHCEHRCASCCEPVCGSCSTVSEDGERLCHVCEDPENGVDDDDEEDSHD